MRRGVVGARVLEVLVFRHICVLCASCGRPQCCVMHDLQFVNGGQGWKSHTPEPVS